MPMPGFSAEAASYRSRLLYATTTSHVLASSHSPIWIGEREYSAVRVMPQMMRWKVITTVLDDGTICVGIEDEDAGVSVPLGCY